MYKDGTVYNTRHLLFDKGYFLKILVYNFAGMSQRFWLKFLDLYVVWRYNLTNYLWHFTRNLRKSWKGIHVKWDRGDYSLKITIYLITYNTKTFYVFIFISWRLITLQYFNGICHTLTWISHRFTCVPLPDPLSPSHPSGSSQCTSPEHLCHASNPGWGSLSHLIIYMFQCYSLNHPTLRLLPESKSLFCTSVSLFLSCI